MKPSGAGSMVGEIRPVLMNIRDAVKLLGDTSERTLYRLFDADQIETVRVGGRRMVLIASLRNYIERRDAAGENPPAVAGEGHLYVIEFDSGVVKVGRTIRPAERLAAHARAARVHGVEVRRSWASGLHPGCRETERKLIDLCRQRGTQVDIEHFRDITFDDVRAAAELLTGGAS